MFEGNFQVTNPRGAYIWRGDLTKGFLRYEFRGGLYLEGLIYTWRGLFSEFYGIDHKLIESWSGMDLRYGGARQPEVSHFPF